MTDQRERPVQNEDKARSAFLDEAARRYDEMISRAGPASGDTFDDIEEQAEKMGRELIQQLLRERLAVEEKAQSETMTCPECDHKMRRPKTASPRDLDTASGVVHYERRHAICDSCGASFSPSGQEVEDSAEGSIGAVPEEGV